MIFHNFTTNILALGLVLLCVSLLWSRRRYYKVACQLPGPWGLPFIGMGLQMLNPETFLSYMKEKSQHYTAPFISWMGANCFLYVNDPETVETIFNSPHCKNKGVFYRFMADAIGDGLFTSNGSRWTKHRRLINPAFSRQVLSNFLPIFNAESNELLTKFKLAAENGEHLEIYGVLKKAVLEAACQTTIGEKMNFQQNRSTVIFMTYNSLTEVIVRRMLTPWLYSDILFKRSDLYARQQQLVHVLYTFIENLLQFGVNKSAMTKATTSAAPSKAKATSTITKESLQSSVGHVATQSNKGVDCANVTPNSNEKSGEDEKQIEDNDEQETKRKATKFIFVEQVRNCVEQGELTWQDVRDEANVIIAATFETTSTALYLVCLCLAMHAESQDKLYNELLTVFPNSEDTQQVSSEQLDRLTYVEMVINEAMRLFAPVPIVLRSASADFTLSNGVVIPRGTQIGIDIYNMQRSTAIWGEHALEFQPELHFGVNGMASRLNAFAFVPFTRGLRMCIGYRYALMLMKLVVVKVFRHYRLNTDARLTDLIVKGTISLKLRNYPLCTLERR